MHRNSDMQARRQPRNQRIGNHRCADEVKRTLAKRDGKKCAICWSKTTNLIAHHSFELLHDKSPYDDPCNPDYQLLLCKSCHKKVHDLFDRDSPFMRAYHKVCREIKEKLNK